MSHGHRHTSKKPVNATARKPECKVCKDAGKTEAEYTSHWLRDKPGPDGVVICPTLLNNECRYCHEKGHFPSTCPKAAAANAAKKKADAHRERTERVAAATAKQEQEKKPVARVANYGNFASLAYREDSDQESDSEPVKKSRVNVKAPVAVRGAMPAMSYSSAAAKPAPIACAPSMQMVPQSKPKLSRQKTSSVPCFGGAATASSEPVCDPFARHGAQSPMQKVKKSWADDADWDSSDDEDDEPRQGGPRLLLSNGRESFSEARGWAVLDTAYSGKKATQPPRDGWGYDSD